MPMTGRVIDSTCRMTFDGARRLTVTSAHVTADVHREPIAVECRRPSRRHRPDATRRRDPTAAPSSVTPGCRGDLTDGSTVTPQELSTPQHHVGIAQHHRRQSTPDPVAARLAPPHRVR